MTSSTGEAAASAVVLRRRQRHSVMPVPVPLWLAWLLGDLALSLPYLMLSIDAQTVVYEGVAIAAPVAITIGIRRYRPTQRAWYLVAYPACPRQSPRGMLSCLQGEPDPDGRAGSSGFRYRDPWTRPT